MRTKLQVMSDRLLLLYALSKGNESGTVDGTFKLMKIPFMAQLESTRCRINTFNYSFFRWTFGPLTTEIYEDADALQALGLSTNKKSYPKVTDAGNRVLASVSELFAEMNSQVSFVDKAARECSVLGFGALKEKVYKEKVMVDGLYEATIAEAPTGCNVLSAIPEPNACFCLDDDWVDSLWGTFNYSEEDLAARALVRPMTVLESVGQ